MSEISAISYLRTLQHERVHEMHKGPMLNNNKKNFTTRDSLGIESVAAAMQAELCPIVNTVTPRAFYWPFMAWLYYDYLTNYRSENRDKEESFNDYVKRQDYFFVLSVLINNTDQSNLVGKEQSQKDIDASDGPYPYNKNYFQADFGGMQYYNAGCLSMYYITETDNDDNRLKFPKLTKYGKEMAIAFESVIKETDYYKYYRLSHEPVPKRVLEEYGRVINLSLDGFDDCKRLLKSYLFEDARKDHLKKRSERLSECAGYISAISASCPGFDYNMRNLRRLFFDNQLPDGKAFQVADDLKAASTKWKVVAARMYFTSGLEMIWKYMLEMLTGSVSLNEWLGNALNNAAFTWDLSDKLMDHIDECFYDNQTREDMISATARKNTSSGSIENGLKIILSMYNQLACGTGLDEADNLLDMGKDSHSISLSEMIEQVNTYKNRTVKDFIIFIMQKWLVEQHRITATEKMFQGRDGFYYEYVDGKYSLRYEFRLAFQGIRLIQLSQVMKDLGML